MTKKTLSVLLALLLVLSLFPTAALAEEESEDALPQLEDQLPEAGPEDPETPETGGGETALTAPALETAPAEELTVYPDADLPENDELFQDYIDLYLAGVDPSEFGSSVYGVRDPVGDKLTENDAKVYEYLKTEIGKIAENGGSAVIELPLSLFFTSYVQSDNLVLLPMSYFDKTSIMDYQGGEGSAEFQKISAALEFNFKEVLNALLSDCPYSLYWYDKTQGTGATSTPSYGAVYLDGQPVGSSFQVVPGKEGDYTIAVTGTYEITFPVAKAYQDSTATTPDNTVKKTNLTTVKNEINTLVNKTYDSDYARLEAYKDYICGEVSYDTSALTAGTAYGDPWQLISVFDKVSSTNVVCEGYAKAFQYLCDRSTFENSNVECYLVSGVMSGGLGDAGGGHMWNVVRMEGGKSYLVDVTNSDEGSAGQGGELFLAGVAPTSGSAAGKNLVYTFKIDDLNSITFQYYDGTKSGTIDQYAAYGNVLELAEESYKSSTTKVTSVELAPTAGTRLEIPSSKSSTNQLSFTLKVKVEGTDGTVTEDPNLADSVKLTLKIDDTHTLYWPASDGQVSGMLGLTLSHAQSGIVDLKSNSNLNSTELNTLMGMITNSTGKECDLTASYGGQTATVKVTLAREAAVATTFSGTVNGKKLSENETSAPTLAIPLAGSTPYPISFTVKDQYGTAMAAPTYKLETAVNGVTVSGSTMTVASAAEAGTATLVVTSGSVSRKYPIKLAKIEFSGLDNVTATGTYGETWRTILGGISFSGAQAMLDGVEQTGEFKAVLPTGALDAGYPSAGSHTLDIYFNGVSTGKTATVTVAPKPITVTVNAVSRPYGQANPAFTGTVNASQLVSGDNADSLKYTLTTTATETTAPGTYDITGSAAADSNSNYQLSISGAKKLTVERVNATLTLTPAGGSFGATDVDDALKTASGLKSLAALPTQMSIAYTSKAGTTLTGASYTPEKLNITGWSDTGVQEALDALAADTTLVSRSVQITPVYEAAPAWADPTNANLTYAMTITGKDPATVTVTNAAALTRTYDKTAVEPVITVTSKGGTALTDTSKQTVTWQDAKGQTLTTQPTSAGTYKVTVTYQDENNYGTTTQEFTISPKELIGLTWAGADTRDYNGAASSVTATVTTANGLIDGDVVTVTVSGGDATNAGTHTATATGLTGADAGNYTLPDNKTTTYTINKANRTLTVTIDHAILCPKLGLTGTLKVDCTGDDTAAITLALTDPIVAAYALDSAARASADVVRLDSAARTVTAIGNGTAQVTASVAATTNYNAATADTPVTVKAYAKPIPGDVTATSDDGTAKLAAKLDGSTIVVSGIIAEGKEITGITDGSLYTGLSSSYADGKLTITETASSTVVAEYTVDTEAVVFLPSGVKLEEGDVSGEVAESITATDEEKTQVQTAVKSGNNTLTGAVESAASTLVNIATAEAAKPGNDGKTVTVQVDLKIEAKAVVTAPTAPTDAKKASYTIDVQPVCSVYVTDNGVTTGQTPVRTENLSSGFATPVTVTVELPAFLASALDTDGVNLFAKHTRSDGTVEYLETTVDTVVATSKKTATWQMSSFSDVELYAIADKTITVSYKDSSGNVTQTVTYGETDRGENLLDNKTWTIGGQQYTTVAQLLDSALTGSVEAVPYTAPVTPVDPEQPSRPSGGGGGGGGGGSSFGSYSISAPTSSSKHGSVSLSTTSARKGDTVTITPKPDAGYVLDTLVVRDSSGKQIEVKAAGDGKYTFVMPAGQVTVEATFRQEGESGSWPFADVDRDSFWAAGAIAWVYEQGYMNGNSASTFNPGGTITRQQMWMILARLSGQNPASFAEARQWAIDSGVSDGTNGPNAMSRQQMVTFLYRYAQLKGYTLTGSTGIDAFPDSGLAANYAQEPLAWAVGNGIVTGTSDGALNPTGTATRAHFAVILQRFCENTAKD